MRTMSSVVGLAICKICDDYIIHCGGSHEGDD
jgi:hypothetical protein